MSVVYSSTEKEKERKKSLRSRERSDKGKSVFYLLVQSGEKAKNYWISNYFLWTARLK